MVLLLYVGRSLCSKYMGILVCVEGTCEVPLRMVFLNSLGMLIFMDFPEFR